MFDRLRNLFRKKKVPVALDSSEDVTVAFADLFRNHGLPMKLVDGWIVADSGSWSTLDCVKSSP